MDKVRNCKSHGRRVQMTGAKSRRFTAKQRRAALKSGVTLTLRICTGCGMEA